jgi:hypothetical protein
MGLSQWYRETRQRNWSRITPRQAAAVEEAWRKASRHGMTTYLLTRGLALFLWSSVCLLFFGWRGHTLKVMRQPFYLEAVIPCMLLFSLAVPAMLYLYFRHNARQVELWRLAQHHSS